MQRAAAAGGACSGSRPRSPVAPRKACHAAAPAPCPPSPCLAPLCGPLYSAGGTGGEAPLLLPPAPQRCRRDACHAAAARPPHRLIRRRGLQEGVSRDQTMQHGRWRSAGRGTCSAAPALWANQANVINRRRARQSYSQGGPGTWRVACLPFRQRREGEVGGKALVVVPEQVAAGG